MSAGVLERARAIPGWMTEPELAFLSALALATPDGATVVELGSWKGRSTVALGEAVSVRRGRLYAVDTFSGNARHAGRLDEDILGEFHANTQGYPFLEAVVASSVAAADRFEDESVDLVFVDADHSYDAVRRDVLAWAPKLKPGAVMAGHDFGWIGVAVAVRETFGRVGVFESIWYTRKRPGSHHVAAKAERIARRLAGRLDPPE